MQYTKPGNPVLTVSPICMGCMGFGDPNNGQHSWTLGEEHSREIIRHGFKPADLVLFLLRNHGRLACPMVLQRKIFLQIFKF